VEAHETGPEWTVEIEIRGLSVYTRHGVSDAEQEVGQRLELDISLEVPAADAVLTDRVDDTIDYGAVCELAAEAATERSYRTLERLCQVIAERLAERFGCDTVSVRAAKPEPPIELPVQEVAVEVTQTPPPLEEDEELGEE
jgi:dihydroneopterin aldolase